MKRSRVAALRATACLLGLAAGGLGAAWEKAFQKYHPGVRFENRLETTLVSAPGLTLGLADVGASRKITSDELLMFQRFHSYHPVEVSVVTGSLNVPGWSYALG